MADVDPAIQAALEALHTVDCFGDYNDPPEGEPLKHQICLEIVRPIVAAVERECYTRAAEAINAACAQRALMGAQSHTLPCPYCGPYAALVRGLAGHG